MVKYSTEERLSLIECYLLKKKNPKKCVREFRCRFPNAAVPSKQYVTYLFNKWRETGSVLHKKKNRKKSILTEEELADIQTNVEKSPSKPVSHLAQECGISKTSEIRGLIKVGAKTEYATSFISENVSSEDSNHSELNSADPLAFDDDERRQETPSPDIASLPGSSSSINQDPQVESFSSKLVPKTTMLTPAPPQSVSSTVQSTNVSETLILFQQKSGKDRLIPDNELSSESGVKQPDDILLETNYIAAALKRLEDISARVNQLRERDDHFDNFGRYVSSLMKHLPTQRVVNLQQSIINLILVSNIDPGLTSMDLNSSLAPSSSTNYTPTLEAPLPQCLTSQDTLPTVKKTSIDQPLPLIQNTNKGENTPPVDSVKSSMVGNRHSKFNDVELATNQFHVALKTLEDISDKVNLLDESNNNSDTFAKYVASLLRGVQARRAMELQVEVVELILRPQINSLQV